MTTGILTQFENYSNSNGVHIKIAWRQMLKHVHKNKKYHPLIPNDETIAAMEASRRRETIKVSSMDELFERLHA